MIVGAEKIPECVEEIIATIERSDPDELVEIEEVMVIAVVRYEDPDENSSAGSLFYRCTSARYHVQLGILEHAHEGVKKNQNPDE